MSLLQDISHRWADIDPRLIHVPLIASDYQIPLIIAAYLYFVLIWGPRFMKNRPQYAFKEFMHIYNIIQIVGNAWIVHNFFQTGLVMKAAFCPFSMDYSINPQTIMLMRSTYGYFYLKLFDYIETIVFVLRKKNSQVSGLHVYHHVSLLLITWLGSRYYAIAPCVLSAHLNCGVHVLMYTYYFLAALGPNVQKSVAFMKPWITRAQMVQFCIIILHTSQNFFCKAIPHWVAMIFIGNTVIVFFLFYLFYKKSYKKQKNSIDRKMLTAATLSLYR